MKSGSGARCSPGIKALLNVVNALPSDTSLPRPSNAEWRWDRQWEEISKFELFDPDGDNYERPTGGIVNRIEIEAKDRDFERWSEELIFKVGREAVEKLFDNLRKLGHKREDLETEFSFLSPESYEIVAAVRLFLRYRKLVANVVDLARIHKEGIGEFGPIYYSYKKLNSMPLLLKINYSDNRLDFEVDRAIQSLKGCDFDRIRECSVCGKIFWASRTDAEACSKQCGNTLNGRRHRVRQLEDLLEAEQNGILKRQEMFGPNYEIPAQVTERVARLETRLEAQKKKYGLV